MSRRSLRSLGVILIVTAIALAGQSLHSSSQHQDVRYLPTPQNVVDAMLTLAHVTPSDVVFDLGSGDGRIPITAAKQFGARGVGIEIDPALVRLSRDNAAREGVSDRVTFIEGDLFQAD